MTAGNMQAPWLVFSEHQKRFFSYHHIINWSKSEPHLLLLGEIFVVIFCIFFLFYKKQRHPTQWLTDFVLPIFLWLLSSAKKVTFQFSKINQSKKKVYFLAFCVVATYINMGQKYLCFRFDKDLHCPPVAVLQYDLPVEINSSLQWSAGWGANSNCFMDEHGWVMDRL